MKRKKLVIISHTEHYLRDGEIVGWGPTVNEINYLADYWDEVVHVACLHSGEAPLSSSPYTNENTRLMAIRPTGGGRFWNKLNVIFNMPAVLRAVSQAIESASHIQFRGPTGIGVFLLPAFSLLFKRNYVFWVKYAGNWNAASPPLSYRFQRWWLRRNFAKCKVTINGFWPNQPEHCDSFENPCLTAQNLIDGKLIQQEKRFCGPFRLAFVGRLEDEKGVARIIEALKIVDLLQIERIDFVGDGAGRSRYESQAAFLKNKLFFHGSLNLLGVHEVLSQAHFLVLPSLASEGFPKVIAEAACYGCIPVVSDVSSVGHYITEESSGYLWKTDGTEFFSKALTKAISADGEVLARKSKNVAVLAEKFTFAEYQRKLEAQILDSPSK